MGGTGNATIIFTMAWLGFFACVCVCVCVFARETHTKKGHLSKTWERLSGFFAK